MISSIKHLSGRVSLLQVKGTKMFFENLGQRTCSSSSAAKLVPEDNAGLKPFSEIPGPLNFPVLGVIPYMLIKKFDKMRADLFWKSMKKEFGPIIRIKAPGMPWLIVLTEADDIQKMYQVTMKDPVRTGFHSMKKVRDEATNNYFEKKGGLLVENNEEWYRVRSRVQTPMLKPQNIFKYLPQVDEVSIHLTDRMHELQQQNGEMPEDFIQELYKWALESVGLVALNRRLGCLDPNQPKDSIPMQMIGLVDTLFDALTNTEMDAQWWRFVETKPLKVLRRAHDVLLQISIQAIKETEELLKKKPEDAEPTLMETLLLTDGLTQKDVVTLILDMIFAGIDTTSHTIAFALHCLATNKEAQKKLQAELDTVMGDGNETINEKHLARLSYLKFCVKESLRKFPLVMGNARTLTKDAAIGGYLMPKGNQLIAFNILTASDEKYFARPLEYIPERWARDKPLGDIHPYASLPFSHGSRMCIGRRIAEQEIYTLLARIFHRFDVDYNYGEMGFYTRLVSMPSKPLKFEFKERKK